MDAVSLLLIKMLEANVIFLPAWMDVDFQVYLCVM